MLDALTALGVASSVMQFVDFAIKLVSDGVELYKKGTLTEHDELELATKDLTRLTEDILDIPPVPFPIGTDGHAPLRPPSQDEYALQELAASCTEIGKQLLALLKSLKVRKSGKPLEDRLASFRQAVRSARKKGQLQNVEKRLKRMREQLSLNILALLSKKQSRVLSLLNDIVAQNEHSQTKTHNKIDELKGDIISALRQASLKSSDLRDNGFVVVSTKCRDLADEGERVAAAQRVLRSLGFKEIKARQSAIKEAHRQTFEWIFEDTGNGDKARPNFCRWLENGRGVYWVSGKAGSGKSTLMKLLCDHPNTHYLLKKWAGADQPVTANYFFWSAGNEMQKSQQGLLQSFLYQILSRFPDLITTVCPSRFFATHVNHSSIEPWTSQELSETFENLLQEDLSSARFCFFVDGLDEYDGEESDIIKILQDLTWYAHVKICASSRPWNAFEKAFGNRHEQKLHLQDYTKDDIRIYVQETLEQNEHFLYLARENSGYKQLVDDIVERASGVFLWVYLVIRSLLRGITDDNNMSFMRKRLDALPVDLEEYFRQMTDTIEDVYRENTAQIFQLMVCARSTLPAISFWFFDKESEDPDYALKAKVQSIDDAQLGLISERVRTHLNACCKDLLEVHIDGSTGLNFSAYRVDFLHRTVRDFLMTRDMYNLLRSRTKASFDARTSLCRLLLAQVKALPNMDIQPETVQHHSEDLVRNMIIHAHDIEVHNERSEHALLDELDRSLATWVASPCNQAHLSSGYEVFHNYSSEGFMSMVTRAGLCIYVSHRLKRQPELLQPKDENKAGLLEVAVHTAHSNGGIRRIFASKERILNVEMVRILLALGANPNAPALRDDTSVWQEFLSMCSKKEYSNRTEEVSQISELFILYGADTHLNFVITRDVIEIMWSGTGFERAPLSMIAKLPESTSPVSGASKTLQQCLSPSQFATIKALSVEMEPQVTENHEIGELEMGRPKLLFTRVRNWLGCM